MKTCHKEKDGITSQQWSAPFFDNLWSYNRLAEFLDVPTGTLRDWVYKRQIPFIRVGHHIRFNPSDIRRWLSVRRAEDGHL